MRYMPFVISIGAAVLWVTVFFVFGKLLGVPLPARFHERSGAIRRLTFKQYACLYGALEWGMAMLIASLVDDYFEGKLSNNPVSSAVNIAFGVVIWLGAGCFFGWTVWGGHENRRDSSLK